MEEGSLLSHSPPSRAMWWWCYPTGDLVALRVIDGHPIWSAWRAPRLVAGGHERRPGR
jgi:hypothetical protein